MITSYEIRENILTRNSVFLLLLKADKEGCDAVLKELSSFCKLINNRVKDFDYVFELSGITDDTMLEKIRKKIEDISSSISDVTETFNNALETETITIATDKSPLSEIDEMIKKEYKAEDLLSKTENRISRLRIYNADSTSNSLKPISAVTKSKDTPKTSEQETKDMADLKKTNSVEEENKTIMSFSNEEMKDVSVTLEPKQGLFGSLFGKIKSAIKPKSNKNNKTKQQKEKKGKGKSLSDIVSQKVNALEQTFSDHKKDVKPQETPKENPFQNLGEGIIIKKGILSLEEDANSKKEKPELTTSPVVAKLQVDDIFAAETICDFYGDQPESVPEERKSESPMEETALDKLEKIPAPAPKVENIVKKEKPAPASLKGESKTQKVILKEEKENLKKPSTSEMAELTLPDQLFTQKENEKSTQEEKNIDVKAETKETKTVPSLSNASNKQQVLNKPEGGVVPSMPSLSSAKNVLTSKEKVNTADSVPAKPVISKNISKEKTPMHTIKQEEQKINTAGQLNTSKPSAVKVNPVQGKTKLDHTLHVSAPAREAKYRNYPIEMPLIPTYTFANMDISAIRFAHAMAMGVLDSLGVGNNPFLVQGIRGTGKTHFLHAMGYEISKRIPQSKILFTNGVRFSRGVQYLLERGQQEKLDAFFKNAEVLIIDDVHLTAINEHNRGYISKVLNDFLNDKKQIIMSSKYPPESLKRFEELVNFKFSAGTIAELKIPRRDHFIKLAKKVVSSSFLNLTDEQVVKYFCEQNGSLGDVARDVKRVKVLLRRIESSGLKEVSHEDILKVMTSIDGENEESQIVKKGFSEITALEKNKDNSWGNFGFFFPASQIDKFKWVAFASQEAAKDLGIKGGFNYSLKSAYATEHIISAAFKIANICDIKGLKGAVVVGPSPAECQEPIRDNFYDILTHMLEVMMIRCGTINFEDIKKPSAYVKMLGDILK